jgi:uncharacterized protein YbjT (DUF2867 family)
VGGRLVTHLLEKKYQVRVLVRDAQRIAGRKWANLVEVAVGDLTDLNTLKPALEGIDAAYYLVHSMYTDVDFAKMDRMAAENFVKCGKHLKHVIYLGGILPKEKKASRHLESRAEVGKILRADLPTTEFRAGPIIGSGSASFELLRYFVQRIPIMLVPTWILNQVQSIAIRDILSYLLLALEREPLGIVEVGADRITFRKMIDIYTELRGLTKRIIITLPPLIPPNHMARWFGIVSPVPDALAIPIVEGICHNVVADTSKAEKNFPEIKPIQFRLAVELALNMLQQETVPTCWSGAQGSQPQTYELVDREGLIREVRTIYTDFPAESVFSSVSSIGGKRGWLVWRWVWEIRGVMDKIMGGPGLRRGRRHPTEILPGEALDFWRVEEIKPPNLLRLRAEMKVPGRAWMQWEVRTEGSGSRLIQTAMFDPKGFLGTIYWYILYPIHKLIFNDLVRAIAYGAKKYMDS